MNRNILCRFFSLTKSSSPSQMMEPKAPILKSVKRGDIGSFPGPKSRAQIAELSQFQDSRTVFFISDLERSIGNYIADIDGNMLLDMHCMIASIAVGYNHPTLLEKADSDLWRRMLVNRPALGLVPPNQGWIKSLIGDKLDPGLMQVAPKGLDNVFTSMCGSCANEIALKTAFMYWAQRERGKDVDVTTLKKYMTSCMNNETPGSPDLAVLSFTGGFHGRLFGSLSLTRSKAIHKVDIPAFPKWPAAPFPRIKYSHHLDSNLQTENDAEEDRCLEATEKILREHNNNQSLAELPRIAAMIVEPIQGEGGDNHASPRFFRGLQALAKRYKALFIVDEVQTGVCATGTFWAHESWNLPHPPDMVTFAKKMQIAGFYFNRSLIPSHPYRNFNTWMGDPIRLLQCTSILGIIEGEKLLHLVQKVSPILDSGLRDIAQRKGKDRWLLDIRGKGTFYAWNCATSKDRDLLIQKLRSLGVHMGPCGDTGIRVRPSLIFGEEHCRLFLDLLEESVTSLSNQ